MSKVTVAILVLCAVAVYYANEAEAKNNCKAPVPADAKFHKSQGKCKGVKVIKGENCCCRCNGNPKARGYYCNKDYCQKGGSTTASSSGTTSASSATDSTTGGSSDTTSSSGSSDSTTGSSGTSGSSDSTTSSSDSSSSSDSTTASSSGSS